MDAHMGVMNPDSSLPPRPPSALLDRIGASGSMICAVHCALMPFALALLPTIGLAAWLGEGFDLWFVSFVTLFGLFVLVRSYRRHRALRALALLLTGLAVLWAAVLFPPLHHALVPHAVAMTFGGTLVGLAHLANLRLNHGHVHDASCVH